MMSDKKKGEVGLMTTYKLALIQLVETEEKRFSKEIMRYLFTKKKNVRESLAGNYLRKQFQRLECGWMTSRSTRRLVGSDSDYVGNASEVCTEGSLPTPDLSPV